MTDLIGHTIDRYHILEQLGQGGMATVYKAYDTRLERDVAIKIIRTDLFGSSVMERLIKRFELEAKTLATLNHEHIVKVFDFGEYEGTPYLVMDYFPGTTLKQLMTAPIPWQKSFELLLPIASALAYAHEHQVLHRDIKPSNILLTNANKTYLSDFGIAKVLKTEEEHTLTGTGVGVGTPEYMAPEQGMGKKVDERADIYAFGVVLYEMITGEKPYSANTPMAVLLKHISDPVPRANQRIKDLPEAVEKILIKAMAKDPNNRFQSMQVMISAMQKSLQGQEDEILDTDLFSPMDEIGDVEELETIDFHPLDKDSPTPVVMDDNSHPTTPNKWSNRKRWFAFGLALVILVVLFLVGQRFLNGDRVVAINSSGDSMPTRSFESTPNQEVEPEDLVVSADTNQITNNPTMSPLVEFDATPDLPTQMGEETTTAPIPEQDNSTEKITAENFSQLEMIAELPPYSSYISPSGNYVLEFIQIDESTIIRDVLSDETFFPIYDFSQVSWFQGGINDFSPVESNIVISPNDKYFYVMNDQSTSVYVYDLNTKELVEEIVGSIVFVSSNRNIIIIEIIENGDPQYLKVDANSFSKSTIWNGDLVSIITSEDGEYLLIKDKNYSSNFLYILRNQNIIQTIEIDNFDNYDNFKISNDNSTIYGQYNNSIRVWDLNTGEIIKTFYGDRKRIDAFFFDDFPFLALQIPVGQSTDSSATIYDYFKNKIICQIGIHNTQVRKISKSPYFILNDSIYDASNNCKIVHEPNKFGHYWNYLGENHYISFSYADGGVNKINLFTIDNFNLIDSLGIKSDDLWGLTFIKNEKLIYTIGLNYQGEEKMWVFGIR